MSFKLGHEVDGEWVEHIHARTFGTEPANGHGTRIVAGVPRGDIKVFANLIDFLTPPFFLLYLLHTPRGEGESGRYQSPELNGIEVRAFLKRFAAFLSSDARHDIWIHSPSEQATIVWDRHNLIFAYGPLARFESALRSLGFVVGQPRTPSPHEHHYRPEFDGEAAAILQAFDWRRMPLHPEDEQLQSKIGA